MDTIVDSPLPDGGVSPTPRHIGSSPRTTPRLGSSSVGMASTSDILSRLTTPRRTRRTSLSLRLSGPDAASVLARTQAVDRTIMCDLEAQDRNAIKKQEGDAIYTIIMSYRVFVQRYQLDEPSRSPVVMAFTSPLTTLPAVLPAVDALGGSPSASGRNHSSLPPFSRPVSRSDMSPLANSGAVPEMEAVLSALPSSEAAAAAACEREQEGRGVLGDGERGREESGDGIPLGASHTQRPTAMNFGDLQDSQDEDDESEAGEQEDDCGRVPDSPGPLSRPAPPRKPAVFPGNNCSNSSRGSIIYYGLPARGPLFLVVVFPTRWQRLWRSVSWGVDRLHAGLSALLLLVLLVVGLLPLLDVWVQRRGAGECRKVLCAGLGTALVVDSIVSLVQRWRNRRRGG